MIVRRTLMPMFKIGKATISRLRNVGYRLLGVKINRYVELRKIEIPRNFGQIELTGPSCLDRGVTLIVSTESSPDKSFKGPRIKIASGVYINRNTIIDAHASIEIACDCMIGPNCYITDGDHGTNIATNIVQQPMVTAPVVIGEGAWLGAGVQVLKGVEIGAGAVVGAGSVVTRSVEPYSIVAGVPARVIGSRDE